MKTSLAMLRIRWLFPAVLEDLRTVVSQIIQNTQPPSTQKSQSRQSKTLIYLKPQHLLQHSRASTPPLIRK